MDQMIKNYLDALNTKIHLVLQHLDAFSLSKNYHNVVNTSFQFFQNHVHEQTEQYIKSDFRKINHVNNVLNNTFFKDCDHKMCANVLNRLGDQLMNFIFDLCKTYEKYIFNEFPQLQISSDFRLKIFVSVCVSIAMFCKFKQQYAFKFHTITQGMLFDPKKHESINENNTNQSSVILMAYKPGIDLYNQNSPLLEKT